MKPRNPAWLILAMLLFVQPGRTCALDWEKSFHDYVRKSWGVLEGLPQSTVLAIEQDADGYLWLGMQVGLGRFDGARFISYSPRTTPELPGETVQCLYRDREGRLWIGTYKGLAVYEDGRFHRYEPPSGGPLDIRAVAQAPDGRVLVASDFGLHRVEAGGLAMELPLDSGASALLTEGDTVWAGSVGGVYRLRGGSVDLLPLPAAAKAPIRQLRVAQGRLWAGSDDGLFERDLDAAHTGGAGWQWSTSVPAFAHSPIGMIFEDRDGTLWVGAHDGLARVRGGRVIERLPRDSPFTVPDYRSAYEDHEGNLWLGSRGDGVTLLWNGWVRRLSTGQGLNEAIVWTVARDADGDGLWVGTDDGLSRVDAHGVSTTLDGGRLPNPNVYTLLSEPGQLWIGTRKGAAVWRGGRLEQPPGFGNVAGAQVSAFLRGADGSLWMAADNGLYRFEHGALNPVRTADGSRPSPRTLLETRDRRLLVGTQQGVYEVVDGRMRRFAPEQELPRDIDVTALYEFADGTLLVGSLSERLFFRLEARWIELHPEKGAPPGAPFYVAEDARGFVWLAGLRGLFRMDRAGLFEVLAGRRLNVGTEQLLSARGERFGGQAGQCCNGAGNAKGLLDGDRLWLPTRDGVVSVQTDRIVRNLLPPRVRVEALTLHGARIELPSRQPPESALQLPLGARDLTLEFTALSFQDPASVRLRYRLQGYDTDWYEIDEYKKRSARYTNLPPGDYRFEVEGTNNAGIWNAEPAQLDFKVPPRFVETLGFRILCGLGVLLLLGLVLRLRADAEARRRRQLEDMVQARTEELEALNRKLQEASTTDPLTGLHNRRYLEEQLPADLSFYLRRAEREPRAPSCIVFALLDLDRFKSVNDTLGHAVGDRVLRELAGLLEHLVRTADYIARWGGEEFLLVFRPMPSEEVPSLMERVRQSVADHRFDAGNGQPLHMTCSLGFVELPLLAGLQTLGLEQQWQRLLELADRALYEIKNGGRNGWAGYRSAGSALLERLVREPEANAETLLADSRLELRRSPPQPD